MIKKCKVCEREFKTYHPRKKYCNNECRIRDTTTEIVCPECNKKHRMLNCYIKEKRIKTKFCSSSCYKIFKNKERIERENKYRKICDHCGIEFQSHKIESKSGLYYCSQECSIAHQKHENSPAWHGGKSLNNGYEVIKHKNGNYRLLHRIIMEKHLKRKLKKNEVVHHIDGNIKNNDINNLQLMTKEEHDRYHTIKRHKEGGFKNIRAM